MSFRLKLTAVALATAALAGCGGGSSSSSVTAPAGALTVSGVVGGTATAPTLAGHPLIVTGPVTVNGKNAAHASVLPGSVIRGKAASSALATVRAAGTASATSLTLSEVDVSIEITGTVDSINVANGTLQVQGQTVTVDALTQLIDENPDGTTSTITLADLAVGDYVEVSGSAAANGTLEATLVEKTLVKAGDAQYSETDVHGVVSNLDTTGQTFTLGGETVNYAGATVQGTLANGATVEVAGSVSGTTITAVEVQVEDSPSGSAGEDTELSGMVQQLDTNAETFTLLGYTVDYSAISPAPTLQDGARVEVQGTVDPVNTNLIHATALQVDCEQGGDGNANGEAKGQVTAIDTTGMTLTLGTSTFWVDASTVVVQNDSQITFDQIAVGSWVEVKFDSTRQQAGASYATAIDVQDSASGGGGGGGDSGEVDIEGSVSAFDGTGQTVTVNAQTVGVDANTTYQVGDQMIAAADFWGTDRTGATVEIHAHQSNSSLVADKIEVKTQD